MLVMFDFDTSDTDQTAAYGLLITMVTLPTLVLIAAVLMTLVRLVYKLTRGRQAYKKDYLSDSESQSLIKFLQLDKENETIHITKETIGDTQIGICLEGGVHNASSGVDVGIFVKMVKVNSPAEGKLFPGDRILSVNDLELAGVSLRLVVNTIRKAQGSVKFIVKRIHHRQREIIEAFKDYQRNMMAVFTRQQIEEIADGFSVYDRVGDGTVKARLVLPLVRSLGYSLQECHLQYYMNQLGLTAQPYITLKDFINIMHKIVTEHNCYEDDIQTAYSVFNDDDGTLLTTGKLKQAFKKMPGGMFVADTEMNDILRLAKGDMRSGGVIKYRDFRKLVLPTMKLY